jgi:hypothetical protein
MYFWTHAWSGHALIQCGERVVEQNLYTKDPGWKPVHFALDSRSAQPVEVRATGVQDPRAQSPQVICFEAFSYQN